MSDKLRKFSSLTLASLALLTATQSLAEFKEITIGYGRARELSRNYINQGVITNTAMYRHQVDSKLAFMAGPSLAYWHADTSTNKHLIAVAVSGSFRAYFTTQQSYYRPFLQVAVGPCLVSKRNFGTKTQGAHFLFQDRLGAGIEVGKQPNMWLAILEFTHYSNAGFFPPNPGFNIPIVASFGYAF